MVDDSATETRLGWFLQIWLGLMVVSGLWVGYRIGMQIEDLVSHADPRWQTDLQWALPSLLAAAVFQALGACLLLLRFRIGVFVVVLAALAALVINIMIGVAFFNWALPLVLLVVLLVLVRGRWHALR